VYWGTNNAGKVKTSWSTNAYLGPATATGFLTNTVYNLASNTLYYFAFYATNLVGDAWATNILPFSTLGPPSVDNGAGATNLTGASATLCGTSAGNPTPDAYIYWVQRTAWPTNPHGPTWCRSVPKIGAFSTSVTVSPGSTYYYRCYASNSIGQDAWAFSSVAFTSPAVVVTQYWDTAADAGLQGGNGMWSTTDAKWSTATIGTALAAWSNPGAARFLAPSSSAASTITLTNAVNVNSVIVSGSQYTLILTNGGQMQGGAAISDIGCAAGAANNKVMLVGGSSTSKWDVGGS